MRVKVLRQQTPVSEPYWEYFKYDGPEDASIAALLDHLNYNDDITDENGNRSRRISWECSCLQGVCGACAMVINNEPRLACETFIKDLKGKEITIRPLRKFPVVCDLVTDRSLIQDNLTKVNLCIEEYHPSKERIEYQYLSAKCLKCGLCLEVCPNYTTGNNYFGAAFANDCYLVNSRNDSKSSEIKKIYNKHFGNTCSVSLSCMEVCPMEIPLLTLISKMNR